jgi:Leucine-rich repeat (LRR) protein
MNSFIEERRQNILEEKNTAQQDVLDFLENLHPAVTELVFKEPLNGSIDFTILRECNFTNITSIKFVPGNITSIINLPNSITELSCPNNLLVDLDDLTNSGGKSLVVLDIPENGLKHLDFKSLNNLKYLNINKNNFVDLRDLPSSLEILLCNNNKLKELDLEGVENLKTLHCENNPMLVISHYHYTITDLKMDNNSNLEQNETTSSDREITQSIEVNDAIRHFFELKNEY